MSGRKRTWERERKRRREDNTTVSTATTSNTNTRRNTHHSGGNFHSLESNSNDRHEGQNRYNNHYRQHHPHKRHYSHNNTYNNNNTNRDIQSGSHSSRSLSVTSIAEPTATATSSSSSEPAVREIPGFYFDPEKKKYFKITANHLLGSQHPFSQQSIKQKTQQKPVLDPIKKQSKRRPYSASSQYGCLDSLLRDRQLGLAGHPRRQLCDTHALLAKRWQKNKRESQYLPSENEVVHTQLLIDHKRQDIYLGSSLGSILWQHQITESSSGRRRGWVPLVERVQSNITSLYLTSDDYIVSTHLGDMGRSGTLDCYKRLGGPNNLVSLDKIFTYSPQKSSIWSSSIAGDKIVVGADQKAIHFQGWKSGRPQVAHLWVGSDIFSSAIDPPEKKGNLVYVGCRNGNVRIFDLNQPNLFSSAMEKSKKKQTVSLFSGIGHKESSVHCMRRVSEYYLVTAAMNGEISMWDTRFIAKSGGGGGSSFKPGLFAKPLLSFRDSISNYSTKTRFDINEEETLLASDNIEGKLSLWSLRTGDRIQDFDVSSSTEATSTTEAPVVSCIAFSKDQRGIWAVTGDQLQYWGIPEHE